MSKIERNIKNQEGMTKEIENAVVNPSWNHSETLLQAGTISRNIVGNSSYEDVEIDVVSHISQPTDEKIIICSDASVIPDDNRTFSGYAAIGFLAYTEKSKRLVACGQGELVNRVGRKFSSFDAENIGILVASELLRDFPNKQVLCDNMNSVENFHKTCRHNGMYMDIAWEKGHADSLGNIFADALAGERMKRIVSREKGLKGAIQRNPDLPTTRGQISKMEMLMKKYDVTMRNWKEKISGTRIDTTSCLIKFSNRPVKTLRTSMVHTPCLESPHKHVFMCVGLDDKGVISSVETGSIGTATINTKFSSAILTHTFIQHICGHYEDAEAIYLSRNVEKDYGQGLKNLARGEENGQASHYRTMSAKKLGRDGVSIFTETVLRSQDVLNWDKGIRRGFIALKGLQEKITGPNVSFQRPKWKNVRTPNRDTLSLKEPYPLNAPQPF